MSFVLGIDPSLNGTGVAFRLSDNSIQTLRISPGTRRGMERIGYVSDVVAGLLDTYQPGLVVYEDYAFGYRGKSNTIFTLGELGGVLKLLLLRAGIDILLVPPSSLKVFATGSGSAGKQDVGLALKQHIGVSFKTDDQNDAAWLLLLGEASTDLRLLPRDRSHYKRRAVAGCTKVSGF